MRILGWRVENFGVLTDYAVEELSPGITVFQGPNGSGKSTLLGFLRIMFFGAAGLRGKKRQKNLIPPLHEGQHGGTLHLESDEGRYTVERTLTPPSLRVTCPDGTIGNKQTLAKLFQAMDRAVYESVFAFNLEDLVSLKSLGARGVRDKIFGSSMGSVGQRARDLIARTTRDLEHLGCEERYQEGLAEQASLEKRIKAAEQKAMAYPELIERAAALEQDQEKNTTAQNETLEAEKEATRLLSFWPLWEPVAILQKELDGLEPVAEFMDEPEEQLEVLLARVREAREEVARIQERQSVLEGERQVLSDARDESLYQAGLAAAESPALAVFEELTQLLETGRALQTRQVANRDRICARLGEGIDLSRFEDLEPIREEASLWQSRIEVVEKTLAAARERCPIEVEKCRAAEQALHAEREQAYEVFSLKEATFRLEKDQLADRVRFARDKGERTENLAQALEKARAGKYRCPTLFSIALFLTGAVTLFEGAVWRLINLDLPVGITFLGGGLLSATYALWLHVKRKRFSGKTRFYQDLKRDHEAARIDQGKALDALDEALAGKEAAEPDAGDTTAAVQAARIDESRAREELDEAEKTVVMLRENRDQWLQSLGLSVPLTHAELDDALERIEELGAFAVENSSLEMALNGLEAKAGPVAEELRGILRQSGKTVDDLLAGNELLAVFKDFQQAFQGEQEKRHEAETLKEECQGLDRQLDEKKQMLAGATEALEAFFARVGVQDEKSFHEHLALYRRRQVLVERISKQEVELSTRLAEEGKAAEIREALSSGHPAQWQSCIGEAQEKRQTLQTERDRISGDLRLAREAIEHLEVDTELPTLRFALAGVQARLDQNLHEGCRLTLEKQLLETAFETCLKNRRPAVLKQAASVFAHLTENRYPDLLLQEDGQTLMAVDESGRQMSMDQLSLGTVELLYLSLRFGLIQAFAEKGQRLPVIMDDVLVNFDPERADRVAEWLAELAKTHQVLLFTCHPRTVERLELACPELSVRNLPDRNLVAVDLI